MTSKQLIAIASYYGALAYMFNCIILNDSRSVASAVRMAHQAAVRLEITGVKI